MLRKLLFCFLICIITANAKSQIVHETGKPVGIDNSKASFSWVDPGFSESEIESVRNDAREGNGLLRFAVSAELNINPRNAGQITELNDEYNLWHVKIASEGAASLGVIFSIFKLEEGEKVFLYDPGMMNVLGPYTSRNNKESGILPVIPLEGSHLIIEYIFRKEKGGIIELGQISHDALGIFGSLSEKDVDFGTSGPCNVDINCGEGDAWGDEKRAVVKLLINNTYLGTGTLVDNTSRDNIPYILTAQHVVGNLPEAQGTIAIFNYESPWCDGPDGRVSKSIAGADIVATNENIDFSLLELSEFPPILYKPYMAGWNATGNIPTTQVCIHHPSGDVKKISFDYDEPMIGTFQSLYENGFWWILQWDIGTTEGGSSGSPLFDEEHKIIGTLSGGEARCGNSVNDYYARLDIAFAISQNSLYSLKPWLDNNNIGSGLLSGRDPYKNNLDLSDTLFNGSNEEYFVTEYDGGSGGLSTGFNRDSLTAYAEKFHLDSVKEITDVYLFVASSNYVSTNDSVSILILEDNNGPGNIIARERVRITEVNDNFILRVDFGDPVQVNGTFYIAYQNWYKESADSEARQFAIFHGSEPLPGSDYAWYMDKDGWHPFSQHPFSPGENTLYIKAVVVDSSNILSVDYHYYEQNNILLYPNPVTYYLNLESIEPEVIIQSATISDLSGKKLRSFSEINRNRFTIDGLQNLNPGIYLIEIIAGSRTQVYKFVKGD